MVKFVTPCLTYIGKSFARMRLFKLYDFKIQNPSQAEGVRGWIMPCKKKKMAQINWLASLAVEIEWLGYLFWIEENRVWTNKSIEKFERRHRLLLNKLVP